MKISFALLFFPESFYMEGIFMIRKVIFGFMCFSFLFAQHPSEEFEGKQEELDLETLKKWIKEKRYITIKEIGGDLSLSGEIRVEMKAADEKKNGHDQRGSSKVVPTCVFDNEVNLMLDYRGDRTWGAIKIEFDNDMGQVSGTVNKLAVEKAYFGGRVYRTETFAVDCEIGRRNLGDVFESRLEFSSLFDGMLWKINKATENVGTLSLNLGVLLVNDKKNHFGYIGELSFLNIANSGLYTKGSFIDWKRHYGNEIENLAFNYMVSQLIVGYQREIERFKLLKVYLAGLYNHKAKKLPISNNKRANYGWYIGVSLGRLKRRGDFAVDVNYQVLAAQAVPDFDAWGIGRGNAAGIGFYSEDPYGEGPVNTRQTAVGSGNFRGWEIEVLYAITDNLTMLNNFQTSKTLNHAIGPDMKFMQYEIEFIYAF